jgi:hypothetical protein
LAESKSLRLEDWCPVSLLTVTWGSPYLFFCSTWVWIQVLELARRALYHLSYSTSFWWPFSSLACGFLLFRTWNSLPRPPHTWTLSGFFLHHLVDSS